MKATRRGWPTLEAAVDKGQKEKMSGQGKKPEKIFIFLMLDDFELWSSVLVESTEMQLALPRSNLSIRHRKR